MFVTLREDQTGHLLHFRAERVSIVRELGDECVVVIEGDGYVVEHSAADVLAILGEAEERQDRPRPKPCDFVVETFNTKQVCTLKRGHDGEHALATITGDADGFTVEHEAHG